jgi:hypothetical protein
LLHEGAFNGWENLYDPDSAEKRPDISDLLASKKRKREKGKRERQRQRGKLLL